MLVHLSEWKSGSKGRNKVLSSEITKDCSGSKLRRDDGLGDELSCSSDVEVGERRELSVSRKGWMVLGGSFKGSDLGF